MKTVIMAGGKGTRISSVASDIPKPMIPIAGKPILQHQIECLTENGLNDITIVVGHLGEKIKDYFKDGKNFNCAISYYTEKEALGSAGALFKIKDTLGSDFILINGDIIFNVNFKRFIDFHKQKKALATLAAHPNSHPFDSSLLVSDGENRVVSWIGKEDDRTYYKNQVNAGLHILSQKILDLTKTDQEKVDLDRGILKPNIGSNKIFAYNTPEYIKDMGTPERYEQVSNDIINNFVSKRNLSVKQKAVFLDRDGTLTQDNGFIRCAEDLRLIDGVAQAVKKINGAGFLAILITNQPVIARGECTLEELDRIHKKLETDLGKEGAYLDDIYFCPHHPDKGFEGERPEYKMNCDCRKPKPGMILSAVKKYNIDPTGSYMVGDTSRDYGAGIAAGCKAVLLTSKGKDEIENLPACVEVFKSVSDFVEKTF
ncbi:MAG: D-glycero-beta-D-manno-heptose 1,7-bisphosphate 7-phosphatase [Spirochaetaceae bacterium]|jgi:D-glycero-D-manno-heptose 1,7-bisphosphate phosphatase|nr:D-glycero-beta-D-manno-heptose 1,7-bisphosphate 7-phosphatase [Spirochaetaceae bacterium]